MALLQGTLAVSNRPGAFSGARDHQRRPIIIRSTFQGNETGRRGLLSFLLLSTVSTVSTEASDSKSALLQEYLKRSKENKEKNDKERLDGYYKRNYKDYFEFVEGSLQGKSDDELSESEKGIRKWLQQNKK